jgi:hypothetical protein
LGSVLAVVPPSRRPLSSSFGTLPCTVDPDP